MSGNIKCPYCETLLEEGIEICPNCKSWFTEPYLPKFKFTEFRIFIALSILTLGFFNMFWFFINKNAINNLIIKDSDRIKFHRLLVGLLIVIGLYFTLILAPLAAILMFILNIALTYRTLRIIQRYTQNKYTKVLDINPYYVFFFNVLYVVHFIDTYPDRVINTHDYFDFRTLKGFGLMVLLVLMAIFLDSIKFLIRM